MTMMLCAGWRIFYYVSLNMEIVWSWQLTIWLYDYVSPGPVSAFLKVLMTQCDDVSPGPGYRETCHRGVSNGPVMILVKDTFRSLVARLAGCPRLKHSDSRFPPVLSLVRWSGSGVWLASAARCFPLWTIFSDMTLESWEVQNELAAEISKFEPRMWGWPPALCHSSEVSSWPVIGQ